MTGRPTLRLPDDVMTRIPSEKKDMLEYIARYVNEQVLSQYEEDFRRRIMGPLGTPFARHELALLRDYSMWLILGELKSLIEEVPLKEVAAK